MSRTAQRQAAPRAGFTLIEALVALTILAVASAGLIRATEAHVDQVRGLQTRAVALWVAENRLIELQVEPAGATDQSDRVEMLGRRWNVVVRAAASEDPDLRRITINVSPEGGRNVAAVLTGFVDTGRSAL